jgi:hypothetical protein
MFLQRMQIADLDVNVEAAKVASASAKVSIENTREGEVTYKGDMWPNLFAYDILCQYFDTVYFYD